MKYRAYKKEVLEEMNISKGEFVKLMGLDLLDGTYDYALPQQWLDKFVEETGLSYDLVLSTTVWFYSPEYRFGFPVSGCEEVACQLPAVSYP